MEGLSFEQTHVLPARREAVFAMFSEPEQLAKWWGPEGFEIPSIEQDLRVNGAYRIAMQPPEGELFHLTGAYREVDPPDRLAFTFEWDPPAPDDRETLATLDFSERGGATEVRLEQGPFTTEERRSLHDGGWAQSFAKLERLLAG